MTIAISITEANLFQALGDFLTSILPTGTGIYRAQVNRVAEPTEADFVMMTPGPRVRLETNVDSFVDALFEGSIAGATLNITAVGYGVLGVGSPVFGVGVASGTAITALGTGSGGVGSYTVAPAPQTVPGPVAIAAGGKAILEPTEVTVQLDVHGPHSADNAQTISALFRDDFAVQFFDDTGFDLAPLYTSDPRQIPFSNDQQQVEYRWVIDAVLQVNPVLTVPQQFADALAVGVVSVDAAYPPV